MIRALLSVVLIALASTSALAKPKIAILGLEVTGTVDQAGTGVARDLTEGLRQRAKVGGGPYSLAPNSNRDLIDEKVIKQCETEEARCMSEIALDIEADVLVYGKLEKDGGGFQATIVLLDVKKRTTIKTTFVAVPPGASSDTIRNIANKTYLELAPASAAGTAKLVIEANVESGSVFVDDDLRDTLAEGRATLKLPAGRYRIAVESDGYQRKEITVNLSEDATAAETFALTKSGGKGGFVPWKPIFGVTAVAALGLGAYSLIANLLAESKVDETTAAEQEFIISQRRSADSRKINSDDCDTAAAKPMSGAAFQKACAYDRQNRTFAYLAIGVGTVALVAGYFAFIREGTREPSSSAQRRTRNPAIAITPMLSPESGGAILHIEW